LGLKALELGENKKNQQGLCYPLEELNQLKLLLKKTE